MTNQSEICKARSLFLTRGILNENIIPKDIMHSWVRSKLHHISYEILDTCEHKIKIDYTNIGIKAKEIIQKIRHAQSEYSYIFVLDHHGQILYKNVTHLNDLPDIKCFTEESIGTNAAGISLKTKEMAVVTGCQHYNKNLINYITESMVVDKEKEEKFYVILLLTPLKYDKHHQKLYKQLEKLFKIKEEEATSLKDDHGHINDKSGPVNPVNTTENDRTEAEKDSGNTNKINGCKVFTLTEIEKKTIKDALTYYQWNLKKSSEALGISRSTLYRKLKEYNINK